MIPYKRHTFYALSFFFFAAFMGLMLRGAYVFNLNFDYRYVVHAHSHVAFMGWIHLALITLITYYFLKPLLPKKSYSRVFGLSFISVVGMLISFPIQGYAAFSIIFSSLFLISTYFYTHLVFKYTPKEEKKKASYKALRWALIFMIISSFGPWSLGGIMATVGPSSHWYRTSIYLYLHFQYNSWVILGIIAVILKMLERNQVQLDGKLFSKFLLYFNLGTVLTLFISVLYVEPPFRYFIMAMIGSVIQLYSIYLLIKLLKPAIPWFKNTFSTLNQKLLLWAFILFIVKAIMQLAGSTPEVAQIIAQNSYLAIGFLHLIFLGVISLTLFALLEHLKLLKLNKISIQSYVAGFIATEIIIFYKPAVKLLNLPPSPNYEIFLFISSLLLLIGVSIILIRKIKIVFV